MRIELDAALALRLPKHPDERCRLAVRRDSGTVSSGRRSLPMHPRNVTMALR
jgi:hypothetical protein